MKNQDQEILKVANLKKYFFEEKGFFSSANSDSYVKAVDDVSFSIIKGQIFGLAGESGCGKSTLARLMLCLIKPEEGKVFFEGKDVSSLDKNGLRSLRKKMQVIFQNPAASLNPRMTVEQTLREVIDLNSYKGKGKQRVTDLLQLVGFSSDFLDKYPHELSGGECQRIAIARCIAAQPEFIVADEPVSSLDVSIQAQILNLLMDLQEKMDLTYLFISHDLAILKNITDKIAVMYSGRIVEMADTIEIFKNPVHPYTKLLLSSLPGFYFKDEKNIYLENEDQIFSMFEKNKFLGCPFYPRCSVKEYFCEKEMPGLKEISPKHFVSCLKCR